VEEGGVQRGGTNPRFFLGKLKSNAGEKNKELKWEKGEGKEGTSYERVKGFKGPVLRGRSPTPKKKGRTFHLITVVPEGGKKGWGEGKEGMGRSRPWLT